MIISEGREKYQVKCPCMFQDFSEPEWSFFPMSDYRKSLVLKRTYTEAIHRPCHCCKNSLRYWKVGFFFFYFFWVKTKFPLPLNRHFIWQLNLVYWSWSLRSLQTPNFVKVYWLVFCLIFKKCNSSQWVGTQRLLEEDVIKRSSLVPESDAGDKAFVQMRT